MNGLLKRAIALLALAAFPLSLSAQRVTIIAGGIDKIIYLPLRLADRLGYFGEEGIEVEIRSEGSGSRSVDKLLVGSVQGVVGFYDHTLHMQSMGKAIVCVVQFAQAPGEVELVSTHLPRKVRSMADLKDCALGVTGFGSSTHLLSRYLVLSAGLRMNQVTFVPFGTSSGFMDGLAKGSIVAGMTTEPTASRLLKAGKARVLVDLRTPENTAQALGGPYPASCLFMQTAWVNRHKPEVQKLVNALVKALKYIHSHSAEEISEQLPPEVFDGDRATYVQALAATKGIFIPDGRMPEGGPANVLRVLTRADKSMQGKSIDLASTYSVEFVSAAK